MMCSLDVRVRGETERSKQEKRLRYATEMCNRDVKQRGLYDIERCN